MKAHFWLYSSGLTFHIPTLVSLDHFPNKLPTPKSSSQGTKMERFLPAGEVGRWLEGQGEDPEPSRVGSTLK